MLLVLVILFLLPGLNNPNAASLSDVLIFSRPTSPGQSLPQDCVCSDTLNRSRWDIVWSCLVTVFACSWVSVHPNIPRPGEPGWKKALRRLELMFWSIIAPELIVYWASSQWLGARYLAEKYSNFNWTETHGYFIQMGGFMLYDGEEARGVICPEKLENLLNEKKIAMPTITEEEIQDRSKGDGLSKALVVIQTTWFIAQCIARRVQGLVITELELATLAFAALNAVMYTFWWNKPLDVTTTVPVHLLQPTAPISQTLVESFERGAVEKESNNPQDTPNIEEDDKENLQGTEIDVESLIPSTQIQQQNNLSFMALARQTWWLTSGILFRWLASGVVAIVTRMGEIRFTDTVGEGKKRVNTFYAYDPTPQKVIAWEDLILLFVGMLFGAIHCAGWNFFFPSLIEANIWRVSSGIITGVPAIGLVSVLLLGLDEDFHEDNFLVSISTDVVCYLMGLILSIYVLARLAVLVEALISLRDLPPGALAALEWTSFIPHA